MTAVPESDQNPTEVALANRLRIVGDEELCVRYHDDALWKWATDTCPQCRIAHRVWLRLVHDPATWYSE